VQIEKITGGTIGTNCYIVIDGVDVILIDFVPEIEAYIKKNSYNLKKILLTHIHFDHFEMLSLFQKRFDFELVLSEKAINHINDPDYNLLSFVDIDFEIEPVRLTNTKIVKENNIVNFNNIEITVLESPGHSFDSLMYVINKEKVVFSGDTLFHMSIGRTDFPTSDYKLIINSINNLFQKTADDYIVYPGHGEKTTIGYEKKNNPFI